MCPLTVNDSKLYVLCDVLQNRKKMLLLQLQPLCNQTPQFTGSIQTYLFENRKSLPFPTCSRLGSRVRAEATILPRTPGMTGFKTD